MRRRNSLRLGGYDYSTPGAYFVTVRAKTDLAALRPIIDLCWSRLEERCVGVTLEELVVLSDYLHGIVVLTDGARQASPLPVVVGAFKSCCSRVAGRPLWQRGYHDRVIRSERELAALRHYVRYNALKPRRHP